MRHRRIISFFLVSVMLLMLTGCANAGGPEKSRPAVITVFGIGKADAILVQADDSVMLIDCGEAEHEAFLLSELNKRGITHLDILQITHFDKDHVGSAAQIVRNIGADNIIYPDYEGDRKEYLAFMDAVQGVSGARALTEVTRFTLGSAELTVFPAADPESLISDKEEYDNDLSLVTRMTYGEKTFLFCGDIENARIKQMLRSGTDWSCDWIKLPHHGKYGKQLEKLLDAAAPVYSVMTVSAFEPADEKTTALLSELSLQSYDNLGADVVTTTDGSSITVTLNAR